MKGTYFSFKQNSASGMRYASGLTIFDERLIQGSLALRYINANGQVIPEMHLSDDLFTGENENTFSITVCGEKLPNGWIYESAAAENDTVFLRLRHDTYPIQITVVTRADGAGWFSRYLLIKNNGADYLPIDEAMPFCGKIWRHRFENGTLSYSPEECGAALGTVYEIGYSEQCEWGKEGDFQFHHLDGTGLTYDGGRNGRSGWSRPSFVAKNNLNGQLFCCELAYSGNWSMSIRPVLQTDQTVLTYKIGLIAPRNEYLRVLAPGEEATTPAVHFTLCAGGIQNLILTRHRFIREQVLPRMDPAGSCRIEANHRGYLCDKESEDGILRDIAVAAAAGAELYVIDAGWYGKEPNVWYDNAGDWYAGSWLPNDLDPIIQFAHDCGMKFGLWMEIEAAGSNSDIRKSHPEYILRRHKEACANGRALDFSNPEVVCWVEEQINRIISRYQLDMFRIDHNHNLNEGGTREKGSYTENLSWRYFENLYALMDRLNKRFPHVSFQNCAGGGGRLDLGILRYFHHTEISDWARPPRDIKIFNGILSQLPPEIQLRIAGTEICESVQDADIISKLHSVMQGRMIFRGIAPSLDELAAPLLEMIRQKTDFYKKEIRPILTGKCVVYLHTPQTGVLNASSWSANEFALPDGSKAFAVVHRLSAFSEDRYCLRFSGLHSERNYRVYCDRRNDHCEATGKELMQAGVTLEFDHVFESELILVKAIS